jgi:glycine oxidase
MRPVADVADVAVLGEGAVGLVTALTLARSGLRVRVIAPAAAPSASSVAAGMLAPALETLLDGGGAASFARLLAARERWSALAASVPGLRLDRSGADLVDYPVDVLVRLRAQAEAAGIDSTPVLGSLHLPQDWRLDPSAALPALRAAAEAAGVTFIPGEATVRDGRLCLDGAPLPESRVVIAAGYGARALRDAAPELAALSPIKGQIVRFETSLDGGPIRRAPQLYLAPQRGGARAGATMEPGRDDLTVEPAVAAVLAGRAAALDAKLVAATYVGEAGIRAATPDGWPLVGPSRAAGVWLAVGARRNGWLLAPLMAQIICDYFHATAPDPAASAFHPGRFSR